VILMTNILIQSPFEYLTDRSGDPLSNGFVYIGEPDKDPEEFPLPVFFDATGIVSAPAPLRTNTAGYPTDGAGNPKRIFTTGPFSIRLRDKNNAQVYYSPNSSDGFFGVVATDLAGPLGAQLVGYRSGNAYDKLTRLAITPQDFGAVADGVNNDQAAFDEAVAQGVPVFLPPGVYNAPIGDFSGASFYTFGGASTNNATVSIVDVTASAFPVGAVMQFPCTPAALPSGFIPLDGALLNRTVYQALFAFANSSENIVADASWGASKMSFSTGNGTSTFRVPDARGLTVAGADNGAGVDAGFAIGSVVIRTTTDGVEPATTDFKYGVQTIAIRAFSGAVNPGLIDITALGTQVNGNTTDISGLTADVAALPLTLEYVSPDQTIVSNSLLTLAHGLGAIPKSVQILLICQVAEFGYDIGDVVDLSNYMGNNDNATSSGITMKLTTTQILARQFNAYYIGNFDTGALATLNAANWKLRIRAYA
jgi:hypothetical protein